MTTVRDKPAEVSRPAAIEFSPEAMEQLAQLGLFIGILIGPGGGGASHGCTVWGAMGGLE